MNWQYVAIAGIGLAGGAVIGVCLFPAAVQGIASSITSVLGSLVTQGIDMYTADPFKTLSIAIPIGLAAIGVAGKLYSMAKTNIQKEGLIREDVLGTQLRTEMQSVQKLTDQNELLTIQNDQLTNLPTEVTALRSTLTMKNEEITQLQSQVQQEINKYNALQESSSTLLKSLREPVARRIA